MIIILTLITLLAGWAIYHYLEDNLSALYAFQYALTPAITLGIGSLIGDVSAAIAVIGGAYWGWFLRGLYHEKFTTIPKLIGIWLLGLVVLMISSYLIECVVTL